MDIQKLITNPSLVEAMKRYDETQSIEDLNHMIDEVMKADFLCPMMMDVKEKPDENGMVTLKESTMIQFSMISNTNNENFFLAFTDWYELKKWQDVPQQQTVIMHFEDYASLVLNKDGHASGFVINPFHENKLFTKDLIANLKKQLDERTYVEKEHVEKGETITYGEPKDYPKEMVQALKKAGKKLKDVHAIYLQFMIRNDEESWLIIVDHDGDSNMIFDQLAKVTMPYRKGFPMYFVPLNDDFSMGVVQAIEPFYKTLFYKKPVIKQTSIAIIEDSFAMKDGSCVVGVEVVQGSFEEGDFVQVMDQDEILFDCTISSMEQPTGRIKTASATQQGKYGAHFGFLIKDHTKDEFEKGCQLRK